MNFFTMQVRTQEAILQKKLGELKIDRFKKNLPIVYKTEECNSKPELYVYEYYSGDKELFAFNMIKQREKTLLKYR